MYIKIRKLEEEGLRKIAVYFCLSVFGLMGFVLSYAEEWGSPVIDEPAVEFRLVCEANVQSDCRRVTVQNSREAFYLNEKPFLSAKDIITAKVLVKEVMPHVPGEDYLQFSEKAPPKPEQKITVDLKFDKQATNKFNEITSKNAGRKIAVLAEGNLLAVYTVRDPVTSGKITFVSNLGEEETKDLADRINKAATQRTIALVEAERKARNQK